MPTYEYRREDGSVFEQRQGINDAPLSKCPETGQKVIRLISGGGGVVYKGDGWYVTDYKDKNGSQSNGSTSGSSDDGSGKPTKPAAQESKSIKNEPGSADKTPADSDG